MVRKRKTNGKKKVAIVALFIILAAIVAFVFYFINSNKTDGSNAWQLENKKAVNPLTGEEISDDKRDKKPVAIMVENSKQSLPQWGLSSADMVFETVVEGGITRNLALFSDIDNIPKIGPVRSVREYYPILATPFNSLFVHYGGSDTGYKEVLNSKMDEIDGLKQNSAFAQDSSRVSRGKEHSYYTNADMLKKVADENKFKMENKTKDAFNFGKDEYASSGTASGVKFAFSNYCPASFVYDDSTYRYKKNEFSAPQIDANTNKQIEVDNVFLLYADVTTQSDGVHKSINLSGGGDGVYLNKGSYVNLNWVKQSGSDTIQLTDTQGNALNINSGKSWVNIIPKEQKPKTSLTDAVANANVSE